MDCTASALFAVRCRATSFLEHLCSRPRGDNHCYDRPLRVLASVRNRVLQVRPLPQSTLNPRSQAVVLFSQTDISHISYHLETKFAPEILQLLSTVSKEGAGEKDIRRAATC